MLLMLCEEHALTWSSLELSKSWRAMPLYCMVRASWSTPPDLTCTCALFSGGCPLPAQSVRHTYNMSEFFLFYSIVYWIAKSHSSTRINSVASCSVIVRVCGKDIGIISAVTSDGTEFIRKAPAQNRGFSDIHFLHVDRLPDPILHPSGNATDISCHQWQQVFRIWHTPTIKIMGFFTKKGAEMSAPPVFTCMCIKPFWVSRQCPP